MCIYKKIQYLNVIYVCQEKSSNYAKRECRGIQRQQKNVVWTKCEEVVAKLLAWKNKLRELFNNLTAHKTSTLKKDSKEQQLFQKAPLLCGRGNRSR